MRFLSHHPSQPVVTPKSPSQHAIPCLAAPNAPDGPTKSAGFGRHAARPGWILAKQLLCAQLALVNRRAFLSTSLAAALAFVTLLAAPARANAAYTWTVTTMADVTDATPDCSSGTGNTCSLRDAINLANGDSGDSIYFIPESSAVDPFLGTIVLKNGTLVISSRMNIMGPGANLLTISGGYTPDNQNSGSTVFAVTGGAVGISGLTISDGNANYRDPANGGAAGFGGGVYLQGGTLELERCAITGNHASAYGGGIYESTGELVIEACTISGNTANESGGGIFNNNLAGGSDSLWIYASTIAGNSAPSGGAMFTNGSTYVRDITVSGNSASSQYGGISNYSSIILYNSIVAGNTTDGVANSGDCSNCTLESNNLIGGGAPPLGPLAWNGGPMQTMMPLFGQTGIIGAGKGDQMPGLTQFDERGFPCVPSSSVCSDNASVDLGAVQSHYLTVSNMQDESTGSCPVTGCTLRDALTQANTDGVGDIRFSTTGTIQLLSGTQLPTIGVDLNLMGPGAGSLTIDGLQSSSVGSVFSTASNTNVTISGITITGGNSSVNGGAINSGGSLTLVADTITGNTGSNGGGISSIQGDAGSNYLTVLDSTVSGNSAISGGGIYDNGPSLTVMGSTISGNTSQYDGGGIFIYDNPALLINSTIAGNSSSKDQGGGISYGCNGSGANPTLYCETLTIDDITISGNSASVSGGGIYNNGNTVAAINSIVAGNTTAGTANSDDCDGCGTQSGLNLIGGNPQLSPLQINGTGTTLQTMIPLPGSPAIGHGDWDLLPPGITEDERGFPRVNEGASSWSMDLGAVQTNYTSVAFSTQPSNTMAGQAISPAPTVYVTEENTNTNYSDLVGGIPITLSYSGGSSEISGTMTETTITGGAATFSGLTPNTAGTGFTFSVSSPVIGGSAVSSTPFDVTPAPVTITLSPASLPGGTMGVAYSQTITASGGTAPYTYSQVGGHLPSGMTLSSGGVLSGTPASSGTFSISVNAVRQQPNSRPVQRKRELLVGHRRANHYPCAVYTARRNGGRCLQPADHRQRRDRALHLHAGQRSSALRHNPEQRRRAERHSNLRRHIFHFGECGRQQPGSWSVQRKRELLADHRRANHHPFSCNTARRNGGRCLQPADHRQRRDRALHLHGDQRNLAHRSDPEQQRCAERNSDGQRHIPHYGEGGRQQHGNRPVQRNGKLLSEHRGGRHSRHANLLSSRRSLHLRTIGHHL